MYYYRASFNQRTVRETRGKGDYADWSRTCENSFESVEQVDESEYDCVKSSVNLGVQDGWLVWAETSSGDSFGHGDRTGVDAIAILSTKEAALQCAEAITKHASDCKDPHVRSDHTFKFASPDGQDVEIGFAPWADYFGGLDEVHVQRVNLTRTGNTTTNGTITVHE